MPEVRVNFQSETRKVVWEKTNGRCYYCGIRLTPFNFHVDHETPLSKGGSNEINNLLPACSVCNLEKKDRCGYEWLLDIYREYGIGLGKGQIAMLKSEGLDITDPKYVWEVPILFYGHQKYRWFKETKIFLKYKGWHE